MEEAGNQCCGKNGILEGPPFRDLPLRLFLLSLPAVLKAAPHPVHPMKKVFSVTLLVGCCSLLLSAQIRFVGPNGTGDGSSWATPAGLSAALNSATAGTQLWLLGGTYLPTTCTDCVQTDREARFELPDGVQLYGGFAGTEADPAERTAGAAPTVLSGDIDQDGTGANNSFTILYTQNVTAATLVDGITLRGGRADLAQADADSPFASGGAWYNQAVLTGNHSSPVMRNCRFEDNYALRFGGGFYHHASFGGGGNVTIDDCTFINNRSESDGAAMYVEASFGGTAITSITDCLFSGNVAELGKAGAIMNQGGENGFADLLLTGCQFSQNTAFSNGGAVCNFGRNGNAGGSYTACVFDGNTAVFGAAIYNNGTANGTSSPVITDCTFTSGVCGNEGGAVYNNGFRGDASPTFLRCGFANNSADGSGGAVFNNGVEGLSSPTFDRCTFTENAVINYGAAVYNFGKLNGNSNPIISNCLFRANTGTSGGAVYSLGSEFGNANPVVTNCTFVDNLAEVGGAIYANGSDSTGTSAPVVTNCIFQGNMAPTGRIFRAISATITVRYSALDVADCAAAWTGIDGHLVCENPLFYGVDPQFENPATFDYRLAEGSPLIDAGFNGAAGLGSVDLAGNDRIVAGTVDLGAYEYGTTTVPPTTFTSQPESVSGCAGEDLALSAMVSGASPLTYQWHLDGEPVDGETATDLLLANVQAADAGSYYLAVTNAEGTTVNSHSATVTVQPAVVATAQLAAVATELCAGTPIALTAVVTHPGDAPGYGWYLNDMLVADSLTWQSDSLQEGDAVYFVLQSNAACVAQETVSSDTLRFTVQENLTPTASFSANFTDTLCLDSVAVFTATVDDAGDAPTYLWLLNGSPTGDTTSVLMLATLQDGDELSLEVGSSAACTTQATVVAGPQIIVAQACLPTSLEALSPLAARVQPNPFTDQLQISLPEFAERLVLCLTDVRGRVWHRQTIAPGAQALVLPLAELPAGSYVLTLRGERTAHRQLLVKQ